jgi:integrase
MRRRKIRQGDVLSMAEAHQLIANVRDPYKPAVWLLLLAGLRPSELCGLRVRSVDTTRCVVHVTESLLPVPKFGDQRYQGAVSGPPKTDAGNRSIPIPEWLCQDIVDLLATRERERGSSIQPDDYLFQTRYGNPLHRDRFREKVVRPALRRAHLPDTIRTYDLRHSHASLLIDLGGSVLAIAQRMGHSDPSVTLRQYGHLFDGAQEQLSERLDSLRRATEGSSAPSPTRDS